MKYMPVWKLVPLTQDSDVHMDVFFHLSVEEELDSMSQLSRWRTLVTCNPGSVQSLV